MITASVAVDKRNIAHFVGNQLSGGVSLGTVVYYNTEYKTRNANGIGGGTIVVPAQQFFARDIDVGYRLQDDKVHVYMCSGKEIRRYSWNLLPKISMK